MRLFSRSVIFAALLAASSFLAVDVAGASSGEHRRYLLSSSPKSGKIHYMRLPDDTSLKPLIDGGLSSPQGLAVDQARQKLYVADPASGKILSYGLHFAGGVLTADAAPTTVASDVKAGWVAVDGVGDVYFSDEGKNAIRRVQDATEKEAAIASQSKVGPIMLYSADAVTQVSTPGGVATDNFHVYWTNQAGGTAAGSLVKASELPPDANLALAVRPLANNLDIVHGACLSPRLAFYTSDSKEVFAVPKTGGPPELITDKLQGPRGCVWDGGGTVFVADKTGNAIYSFPSMIRHMHAANVTKVVSLEDATGLAVVSKAVGTTAVLGRLPSLAAAVSVLLGTVSCHILGQ